MVYTTRFAGGKGGRNGLETRAAPPRHHPEERASNHPQTQGKVERFQQTLQKWLPAQPPAADPRRAAGPAGRIHQLLQHPRPHRSLPHRSTPATAYAARPKAVPGDRTADTHDRVRTDIIGTTGTVTLRHAGSSTTSASAETHAGTHVLLLVQDLHIRIIDAATGELLRELTLDPTRNYQPTGRPPGPTPATPRQPENPEPDVGSGSFRCPERSRGAPARNSNLRTPAKAVPGPPAMPAACAGLMIADAVRYMSVDSYRQTGLCGTQLHLSGREKHGP